jgi:hypothetical protein
MSTLICLCDWSVDKGRAVIQDYCASCPAHGDEVAAQAARKAAETVPEWDVYRKDGLPVTITWEQSAAIWHAIGVVEAVRRAEGYEPMMTDSAGGSQANLAKSRLLGRMLMEGKPPTRTRPPRKTGGPEWSMLPGGDPF